LTPSARLQAVIDILEGLEATAQPADRFLRDWFRARRYAGSKDRAAISERTYDILRHRSSFAWRMGSEARALVIASLLHQRFSPDAVAALFNGEGYGAAPLSEAERCAIASPPPGDPPLHVKGEYQEFLEAELERAFGGGVLDEMSAMQVRAPVDLRVNTLKFSREVVLEALRADGYDAQATSTFAIRIPSGEGSAKLSTSKLFLDGAFEFQDEAAQIAALLCGAKPGMRVLDFAAGAGGKSLALAATMQNRGEIVAHDADPARLRPLAERAERAGATIIHSQPLQGAFNVVLIDAPCSGTGTWRRQPELRWRITPERLKVLTAVQDDLLEQGADLTKGGGRLIYATCSLLPCENEDRVDAFLARHGDFAVLPAAQVWREETGTEPPPGMERFFKATPLTTGTDGFFTALLQRPR
jgi:16S rRNA (cytosine967-C5)-methyltransferase